MTFNEKDIWITGVGILSAIGEDFASFSAALKRGTDGAAPISAFDAKELAGHFGCELKQFSAANHFSKHQLRRLDRGSCILTVAARQALQMAGLSADKLQPKRTSVALGTTLGGMINATRYYEKLKKTGKGYASLLQDYSLSSAGALVCAEFNIQGSNLAYSTACSSANLAIGSGADLIRLGEADVVLVGGFDTMAKMTVAGFNMLRNVSPEKCRPFDKNRQGLVLGEGAGVLILESAEHAKNRQAKPLARFLGYGMSSDAYHMTSPDITGRGPAKAIEAAILDAGINADAIDYINAHGTGTTHNDAIETKAIKRILGQHAYQVAVSSTKAMHGHTLGAAGAIEAIAIIAAMRGHFLPATLNYQAQDPDCDLDYIPNQARENRPVKIALSNNFGFGGNNCSVLFGNTDYER